MPRELPIIMCPEMIKAIQEDRKSQTRQLVKLPPVPEGLHWQFDGWMGQGPDRAPREKAAFILTEGKTHFDYHYVKPRYRVGDELWVRETWCPDIKGVPCDWLIHVCQERGCTVIYKADGKEPYLTGMWRPSSFMPKWAARLWLRVTAVKDPEQIQTISEEDAKAEGIQPCYKMDSFSGEHYLEVCGEERENDVRWLGPWIVLWNRLHPKPGKQWKDNPWVFLYVFERIER